VDKRTKAYKRLKKARTYARGAAVGAYGHAYDASMWAYGAARNRYYDNQSIRHYERKAAAYSRPDFTYGTYEQVRNEKYVLWGAIALGAYLIFKKADKVVGDVKQDAKDLFDKGTSAISDPFGTAVDIGASGLGKVAEKVTTGTKSFFSKLGSDPVDTVLSTAAKTPVAPGAMLAQSFWSNFDVSKLTGVFKSVLPSATASVDMSKYPVGSLASLPIASGMQLSGGAGVVEKLSTKTDVLRTDSGIKYDTVAVQPTKTASVSKSPTGSGDSKLAKFKSKYN